MDQHPVPRNISGFQFHLIGDMTLRQFVYLAIGAGCAFILYKITPLPSLFKILIAVTTGFVGFAFAFIPVQERPLDKWILALLKSINSPTQYLWQKANVAPDILIRQSVVRNHPATTSTIEAHKDAREKLEQYLSTLPSQPHQTLNVREKKYIDRTLSLFENTPSTVQPSAVSQSVLAVPVSPLPKMPITHPVTPEAPNPVSTVKIDAVKTTPSAVTDVPFPTKITTATPSQPAPQQSVATISPQSEDIKKELDRLSAQKETLMKELAKLKGEVAVEKKIPPTETKSAQETKPTVAVGASADIGIPNFPQTPNIVVGVVKDTQKRILPNIIITIKDRTGTPLRALKTGRLGQFSTATPLANDTYVLEVEDPLKRYVFDTMEIKLAGNALPPVEITARGQKEIIREKLTKELFGSSVM